MSGLQNIIADLHAQIERQISAALQVLGDSRYTDPHGSRILLSAFGGQDVILDRGESLHSINNSTLYDTDGQHYDLYTALNGDTLETFLTVMDKLDQHCRENDPDGIYLDKCTFRVGETLSYQAVHARIEGDGLDVGFNVTEYGKNTVGFNLICVENENTDVNYVLVLSGVNGSDYVYKVISAL